MIDTAQPALLRDCRYDADPAQVLDLYVPAGADAAPVLLFVPDSRPTAGGLEIGPAMAGQGIVCAVMRCRPAPAHPFPAGPEDIAAALDWLRGEVAARCGDPGRIVLAGHGIGATHVGGYLAEQGLHPAPGGGIRGAALLSGIYDPRSCTVDHGLSDLFGPDWRHNAAGACAAALLGTEVPLLFTVAERDPADFQTQAAQLVGAWGLAHAAYPPMHLLPGYDEAGGAVERLLADFVRRVAG